MKFIQMLIATLAILVPAVTFAAASVPMEADMPAWVYQAFGVVAGIVGVISQIDAHISEEFKRRWPWWLRLVWNGAAGNYRHSANRSS